MSNKDLTRELKQTIKELTEEKEDLLRNISSKESRVKQILIQLENTTEEQADKPITEEEQSND